MGIESSEDLFIPMTMEGSTCGIVTHPTTDNELHECQNILLSDEFDWDPSNNLFEISSMEEEYRTNSNFSRYINIVADMTQESISLIEKWQNFPLEWIRA